MYILFLDEVMEKVTFGTTQESYTKKKHWPHKAHRRHYRSEIFMTPQKDLENPTSFGVAETKENSSDTSGSMDITKAGRENVQNYLNPFQSGNETHLGTVAGDKGTSIPFLSESALYSLHPEETATYLVETDPAFTNKHRFLSSDYMYRQMTWDPDRITKRLGDGFYEQELVRQQIAGLTGMRYLNGYTDDEEEYKALMDAGIAYAKEYGLKPGISLTKEQMASITSDMVWLETTTVTVNGKTYEVLYPKVYLKPGSMPLAADGSLISANTLVTDTKDDLVNQGTLKGNTIIAKAKNIVNKGTIFGNDISLKAEQDISHRGIIEGENTVALEAGRDITVKNTIRHGKNQDMLDTTAGIAVKGKEGVLLMQAGRDMTLTGATLSALGEKGSMILSAGQNLTMDTDALEARKDMTENRDNYIRTYRKTETSNTLVAGKDITLTTENHVSVRNAVIASKTGAVTAAAKGDVTVTNGYNEARDDYGLKYKEKGLLSSKTTAIRSHDEEKKASLTILSGDTVSILSGKDTRISGSQVIADHNVTAAAGGNVHISSAHEYEAYDYEKQTKKSGILSGGSLGFTIGSEKRKDRYDSTGLTERGSILGSAEGNVFLTSGKELTVEASALAAGKNLALKGQNVTITSRDNVYTNKEEHEYKRSGINISLGGSTFNVLSDVAVPVENAANTHDAKLKALYGYDAYKKLDKNKEILQHFAKGKVNTSLDIGFKNTSYAYYLESQMTENAASQIHARETAALIAEDNIHVQGSDMAANQVSLLAGKNILLKASENRRTTKSSEKSSGFAITASMGASGLTGVKGYISNGIGKEIEQSIFYAVSHIHADDTVYLSSGNDIVLNGSRVKGTRIMARSKHDLLIKSLQDIHTYESGNKGMYFSVGSGVKSEPERNQKIRKWGSFTAGTGYFSGIVHSDYAGVTDQSGLYSGTGGVDLSIRDKTSLKGSVIDSYGTLDKTRLSTGVLEWEDVENHASYTSRGFGASYNYYSHFKEMSQKEKDEVNYKKGLTPQLSTGSKGKSSSETQSAVSQGYIEISKNKQQTYMLEDLKRNTKNALNKLEEIFDKKEIKKKQELAGLFGKLAYNEIHNMKDSPEKTAMHALVGGIMSWFSNDGFMAGATAATVKIRCSYKKSREHPMAIRLKCSG